MASQVQPIPEGYHSVTPYLVVAGSAAAIDFYRQAFGATELMRFPGPDGKVAHAEIRVGDSVIMLADEAPDWGAFGPKTVGGTPVTLMVYVPDVDAVVAQAVEAGAKLTRPVEDKFYGDRSGRIEDPFGHLWDVSTHVEDVAPDELQRRMAAMGG